MTIPFVDLCAMHTEIADPLNALWSETLQKSSFIGGANLANFEKRFAAYCGTTECVGVANGTDSLEMILRGLGIGTGDDVLVPANTFVATAEAVVNVGARPVFMDVDAKSLLVTSDIVDQARTANTKAVIVVHLFGSMPDMDAIRKVTDAHGLLLVEDAAQAHGATWNGRPAGSFGVAASFSFYPGKNLGALGDGGAVVTSSLPM
jgi:dTDP-4-amino-4,6-dideoxygalactose transaminase